MIDKYNPFATYLPDGMTPEESEAEKQSLLRQQMEFEIEVELGTFCERVRRDTQTD